MYNMRGSSIRTNSLASLTREVRIYQNLGKKHKLWRVGMKCALSDITIGAYGSINLDIYRNKFQA